VTELQRDRRAERHTATRQEILDVAWQLGRERGLAGWSLRDVAAAVGMRPPSLYVYFASKNAVYDAMFAQGFAELLALTDPIYLDARDGRTAAPDVLHAVASAFLRFCVSDPARMHLLFLRTIPGFEPSEAAYRLSRQALDRMAEVLSAAGAPAQEHLDLWTALLTGLASQQVSNDPGGDRWSRLVGPAVDMFIGAHLPPSPSRRPA
jgi:AcrR family transcriptional regulator